MSRDFDAFNIARFGSSRPVNGVLFCKNGAFSVSLHLTRRVKFSRRKRSLNIHKRSSKFTKILIIVSTGELRSSQHFQRRPAVITGTLRRHIRIQF